MKWIMAMLMLMLLASSTWAGIFRDDFNDGDLEGWVVKGEASTENGELIIGFPPPDAGDIVVGFLEVVSKDYEVTVSVKINQLMFQPVIANGANIGLRAHPQSEREKRPALQYDLSYNFLLGRHTNRRRGIGAAIWHVDKIVRLPDGRIDGVHFGNKLLEFSPFAFEMDKWYRLKVIARGNRFQVFVDKKKCWISLITPTRKGESICRLGLGTASTSTTLKFGGVLPLLCSLKENSPPLGGR